MDNDHMRQLEPEKARGRFALRPLLLVLGGYHLILGVAMAAGPRDFYQRVAGYPPYNGHFLRDIATFYLALGLVTLMAVRRRSWQVPVLLFTVIQYGLHTVNHVVDVADAHPGWQGPVNVVVLALIGFLAWWLYRLALGREA
jgi:hypothetical protein